MQSSSETPQLRPLSVGEALDAGFRLFRHRFGTLVLCTLVFAVPFSIASTLIEWSTNDVAYDFSTTATDTSDEAIAGALVSQLLQSLVVVFAICACFKAVSAAYLGERASAGSSLRFALPRLVPVVVAIVLTTIVVLVPFALASATSPGSGARVIAMLAAFLLVVFLAIRLALVLPAIVIERKGPFRSLARSWRLTRGHWWRTFAVFALASILIVLISFAGGVALGAALEAASFGQAAAAVLSTLLVIGISVVTCPMVAAVVTVHYYDMRVRNEGFDLELLARGVGADEPTRFSRAPERPEAPAAPESTPAPTTAGFSPPQGPTASA